MEIFIGVSATPGEPRDLLRQRGRITDLGWDAPGGGQRFIGGSGLVLPQKKRVGRKGMRAWAGSPHALVPCGDSLVAGLGLCW